MPIRSSRPSDCALALAVALGGVIAGASCAQPLRTADAPPPVASGAVPVDPISHLPRTIDKAPTDVVVTTLRTPVGTEAIGALVRRLFEGFHARSTAAIEVDVDETVVDLRLDGETQQSRGSFVFQLQGRMRNTPFEQLEVDAMYRPQEVEVWARDELGVPGRPARPVSMGPEDLLVRIPIATARVGADVLFGDEIRLLLRRDGARYRLRGYGENVPR
jgi:hypothetical protein